MITQAVTAHALSGTAGIGTVAVLEVGFFLTFHGSSFGVFSVQFSVFSVVLLGSK